MTIQPDKGRLRKEPVVYGAAGKRKRRKAAEKAARSLDAEFMEMGEQLRVVTTPRIMALLDSRIELALMGLNEKDILTAKPYHKSLIAAMLIDKRQLLNNQPTQILSFEERAGLPELLEMVAAEFQRRGISLVPPSASSREMAGRPVAILTEAAAAIERREAGAAAGAAERQINCDPDRVFDVEEAGDDVG
jgi:hypothetical protein